MVIVSLVTPGARGEVREDTPDKGSNVPSTPTATPTASKRSRLLIKNPMEQE
jgi:hypothetical protein